MSTFVFQKAVKAQEPLRLALDGPAGSGKTYTALRIATFLAAKRGGRIAVIDSERSSAKKYASLFDFDHLTLPDSDPHTYIEAIKAADAQGYAVVIVDSLSHAWEGTLELKDKVQKRSKSNDGFGAWREVTPVHNELVDVLLRSPAHIIATMRTKTEYLVERNEETGKNKVSKVGTKPMQRTGVEFEFDVVGDMDIENNLVVSKTRCPDIRGAVVYQPGEEFATVLYNWLEDGEPLLSAEQVVKITDLFNGIGDANLRLEVKKAFFDKFGSPERLIAAQFDEALTFATDTIAEAVSQSGSEDPDDTVTPRQAPVSAPEHRPSIQGLVDYGREHGVDEKGLSALDRMIAGTFEPRPLDELDDSLISAVRSLVDDVEAGKVEIEPNDKGFIVAREVQAA